MNALLWRVSTDGEWDIFILNFAIKDSKESIIVLQYLNFLGKAAVAQHNIEILSCSFLLETFNHSFVALLMKNASYENATPNCFLISRSFFLCSTWMRNTQFYMQKFFLSIPLLLYD